MTQKRKLEEPYHLKNLCSAALIFHDIKTSKGFIIFFILNFLLHRLQTGD